MVLFSSLFFFPLYYPLIHLIGSEFTSPSFDWVLGLGAMLANPKIRRLKFLGKICLQILNESICKLSDEIILNFFISFTDTSEGCF